MITIIMIMTIKTATAKTRAITRATMTVITRRQTITTVTTTTKPITKTATTINDEDEKLTWNLLLNIEKIVCKSINEAMEDEWSHI